MWVNGKMVHTPTKKYVGGQKHEFYIDLDVLNLAALYQMYIKYGGRRHVVDFYYIRLGWSFDIGLRLIRNDLGDMVMCVLVRHFDGLGPGIPIEIWVDEVDDPVVPFATPMNMVPLQMEVPLSQEDKLQFLLTDIDFNDSYESVATQEFSRGVDDEAERTETVEEQVAGDTEQMDKHVADEENVVGLGSVQEDVEVVDKMEGHNFAQGWDAFLQ
ncbi:hypothetical protein BUALT_Bualt04G0041300 [Buddleja alternifolia]|uniref:Uncharacterized protein n=1 Tax=Buddleja alternifolia TaxID=168488 RepID=A0AAV6XT03_9LAMI|nr:hypothetical protein BUALT_Bualt04G0041300 [Buddleja alternifolia]